MRTHSKCSNSLINDSLGILPKSSHADIQKDINFFRDLDFVSQLISDILFLVLNDPFYHCQQIYRFFNNHQLFQIMPVVQRYRNINKLHYHSLVGDA